VARVFAIGAGTGVLEAGKSDHLRGSGSGKVTSEPLDQGQAEEPCAAFVADCELLLGGRIPEGSHLFPEAPTMGKVAADNCLRALAGSRPSLRSERGAAPRLSHRRGNVGTLLRSSDRTLPSSS
jgi:hypothetical protein